MKHPTLFLLLPGLLTAMPGMAQEDTTAAYHLDPVVVTASQIDALRSTVPNAVTVLSAADLHSAGETSVLSVINQHVPGVFITERGVLGYGVSSGAAGGISIRGTGGSPTTGVLVLTDGRPQLMGLMGHPLPDTYVNSGVERVEVIRGPASLMHGTNAMGGVINIIREIPRGEGWTGSLGTSYGSFATRKFDAAAGYGIGRSGLAINGSYYESSGHRAYSSFKENNGTVRGWTGISDVFMLKGDVSLTGFRAFDPGTVASPAVNHWQDIFRGSAGISLENISDHMQGAVKTFVNWGVHDIYDGFHSYDRNLGVLAYQGVTLFEGNVTTAGADYKRYGGTASAATFSYGRHFIEETGAYLLTRQQLPPRMTLTAGIRLNHHSLAGNELVPQVGLAWQAAEGTTLKASVGKGFRSPTIRELYLFPAPTPTLEPERMWNYEAGVLQTLLEERLRLEFTGFVTNGSNQIRTTGTYPHMVLSNSGEFTHHGVEAVASYRAWREVELEATYSYLERGDQTAANPKQRICVNANGGFGVASLSLGVQYVSGLYGADFSKQSLPDYTLVQARVSVAVTNMLSVYVAGENLLDRDYQILPGYPMPGRTGFLGITWAAR